MTPEPSKGAPDRIRGDGGLGEADAQHWNLWVCPNCGRASRHSGGCSRCPARRECVVVVPAARLAEAEKRAAAEIVEWIRAELGNLPFLACEVADRVEQEFGAALAQQGEAP